MSGEPGEIAEAQRETELSQRIDLHQDSKADDQRVQSQITGVEEKKDRDSHVTHQLIKRLIGLGSRSDLAQRDLEGGQGEDGKQRVGTLGKRSEAKVQDYCRDQRDGHRVQAGLDQYQKECP